jgi:hypothetical protein
MTGADRIGIFENIEADARTLPEALQALLNSVRDPEGSVILSVAQANAIKDHKPKDLVEYRLGRIAEWSLPRHHLDKRFVNLTMMLDKGETEPQRWHRAEDFRFTDLREVLEKTGTDPALALLGAPGSGKSTLLRRLQLDDSSERLRDGEETISFFIQLNGYRERANGDLPEPREWLNSRWTERYPQLPPLENWLQAGRAMLLLDALNEMPHRSVADYHALVGHWRSFAQEAAALGNRIIFSCCSMDYSATLSSNDLRVPQIEVQPMTADQMRAFLRAYTPGHEARIWSELDGSPQFGLFQTPYFLKLLCEQVDATGGEMPKGRAALFTGFVRQALKREINGDLFQPGALLAEIDHQKLARGKWRDEFELPDRGCLISKIGDLAFAMQLKGLKSEASQVRIDHDEACGLIDHELAEDIV